MRAVLQTVLVQRQKAGQSRRLANTGSAHKLLNTAVTAPKKGNLGNHPGFSLHCNLFNETLSLDVCTRTTWQNKLGHATGWQKTSPHHLALHFWYTSLCLLYSHVSHAVRQSPARVKHALLLCHNKQIICHRTIYFVFQH